MGFWRKVRALSVAALLTFPCITSACSSGGSSSTGTKSCCRWASEGGNGSICLCSIDVVQSGVSCSFQIGENGQKVTYTGNPVSACGDGG